MGTPIVSVLRAGNTSKRDPFTICIASNPALELPIDSGNFQLDPITQDQTSFDKCATYIVKALFGGLPNEKETLLTDPQVASEVRVVSLFVSGLNPEDANSLVGEYIGLLDSRQKAFVPFLQRYDLTADIVFAVSQSNSSTRASAWFTVDDESRSGVPFSLDGRTLQHFYYNKVPGTVAIHSSANSLTALHEFSHALSSFSNGVVVDLYTDTDDSQQYGPVNRKFGRPIPSQFASYCGRVFASDAQRDSLGYPNGWRSYHCELIDARFPALMDNYWSAPNNVPENCQHDAITRQFLLDRIKAKISR